MATVNSPFESKYGFKGPGFSVDNEGNIIANSIITATNPGDDTGVDFADFTVTEGQNTFLIAEADPVDNPTITVARQSSYSFEIDVPNLKFNIVVGNQIDSAFYSIGLSHSDGSTGEDVQNKTSGTVQFSVPLNAPDILYYTDENRNNFGIINIVDPTGRFGTLDVNSDINATSPTVGAVTVAGGIAVEKDIFIGGALNVGGTGISNLASGSNLELEAVNEIVLKIDGTKIAAVTDTGLNGSIVDATINNTVIGETTPAAATFSTAQVNTLPINDKDISNKQYTDSTALALSIAFGL